ncbi:DNA ligase [Vibrio diabolicus]|uniref:ATP-dependent DNA ligase n=2 Tax=Vibrio antiquarius (strain Ex25) TaxID=150340 RepID=A0ACA6QMR2_VIBAE|nr:MULTISPECIES: DNA ligase [Vibrio]MCR9606798.1 DNA ligase [Vibrio alginolyticus]ACY51686.1 ATP-dependent DNA ligase [Vibrio antiquarius]EDN56310.1 ATP-dependent DNA ligase domain protein [Vibrio antiquarius]MCG6237881.1 DNA ligase [Vibrio diabolicus]MCR9615305.1 DNA ligase [Vibrio alginolyticus]
MPLKMTLIALAVMTASSQLQADTSLTPPVSLAQSYQDGIDVSEYWYSEKLDGIRAYWTGQHLVTRNGNRIYAPDWFIDSLPDYPLDGELWAGRGNFHLVQQTVLDKTPVESAWRNIDFMIFDMPYSAGDYRKRYYNIKDLVLEVDQAHIKYVEHRAIQNEAHLFAQLDKISISDGEGVMLRKVSSRYQAGRGSDLLKLKRYADDEALVVGYKPGTGRLLGMMGAMLVRLPDGTEFYIGSGFTDEVRRQPPKIGSTITFRYNGFTHNGKPRFARFLRERLKE